MPKLSSNNYSIKTNNAYYSLVSPVADIKVDSKKVSFIHGISQNIKERVEMKLIHFGIISPYGNEYIIE
mgnify:CR=1 FL=1